MNDFDIDGRAPVTATATRLILASPDEVWRALSDLQDWPRWNRALEGLWMEGPVAPGTRFETRSGSWLIQSEIRLVDPWRRLGWSSTIPGTRARHVSEVEEAAGGTRLTSCESLSGPAPRLLRGRMRRALDAELEQRLAALAAEVEPRPARRRAA